MLARKFLRTAAVGVTAIAAAAGAVVAAVPASAAVIGTLSISPTSGSDLSAITITTSAACPGGTNLQGTVAGAGFAAPVNVTSNSPQSTFPTTAAGGYIIPLGNTLQFYGNAQTPPVVFTGTYTLDVVCKNAFGATTFGDFTGQLTFAADNHSYTVASTAVNTTTTLTPTPASPQTAGTSVSLSATVSPAAAGSIAFMDGATQIGASQPVTVATPTASVSTSTLTVGNHSLTAAFTPTDATAFNASTSAAVPYTITGVVTPTTTALSVNTGTGVAFTPVTFTATITPTGAAGSVNFTDGTTAIGSAAVSGGTATLTTSALGQGSHTVTATFVPTDPAAFSGSSSTAPAFSLTAPTFAPDAQTIKATVDAGTLVIFTPYTATAPLDLGSLVLNAAATQLSASQPFTGIKVTDTRAGNLPWTVSASTSDFVSGANKINGENLGLTGLVIDPVAGNALPGAAGNVTTQDNAAASPAVAPSDPGSLGLKNGPHTVAHATNGTGTIGFHGLLTLNAPTSTVAGTYFATLTFTIG